MYVNRNDNLNTNYYIVQKLEYFHIYIYVHHIYIYIYIYIYILVNAKLEFLGLHVAKLVMLNYAGLIINTSILTERHEVHTLYKPKEIYTIS